MKKLKWSLFYDFHTMPACPDVGGNFDTEAFAEKIKDCGVDYIVFPARCNMGMAYYNTKEGIRHPSLKYDLFGEIVKSCQKRDIAVTAYVNAGLSHEESIIHRDWLVLTPEGYTYKPGSSPSRMPEGSFFRTMCYNSGYGEHLLAMLREIAAAYPVEGFFLDCMGLWPCIGGECIREMKSLGMDWKSTEDLEKFAHMSRLRLARKISATVRGESGRDLLIYFNGIPFEEQKDIGTYLEYECLPTGGWGYEVLPVYSRYLRTLGKPVLNMTGRFHRTWGDFGGIRTEASLTYDCLYGLANGMRPTIGDHYHPRGDINEAVFSLYKKVYRKLQNYEEWFDEAEPVTDIAVVANEGFSSINRDKREDAKSSLKGAGRILCEMKSQFDIVSYNSDWKGYKILILPDDILINKDSADKISAHFEQGGKILASGWAGLNPERDSFIMDDWGVEFLCEETFDPAYFSAGDIISENMPDMPMVLYEKGIRVKARPGADILGNIVSPYYNESWDGEHYYRYTPPDRKTEFPAVTYNGKTAFITHPVFRIYNNCAPVVMRQLVKNLMDIMLPEPVLIVKGMPSFGRAMVTRQEGRIMAHLFAYVPERRGMSVDMIEEPATVENAVISLRQNGNKIKNVYLAPERTPVESKSSGDYATARIPKFAGYSMVVFEESE
jgi:hypothetical protein